MGCASSKNIDSAVLDVYRPPATGFAVFDINAIQEPWLIGDDTDEKQTEKPTANHVPSPLLEKIEALEDAPRSWDEVSKALEVLKPTLHSPAPSTPDSKPLALLPPPTEDSLAPVKKVKRKSFSFHTLEELDNKKTTKPSGGMKKTESLNELSNLNSVKLKRVGSVTTESRNELPPPPAGSEGYKSLRDNPFLVRDKVEREREGKPPIFSWDPLTGFPEKCPPGGSNSVVIYTTSLGGVRRTYEDCNTIRSIMELHGFIFEERDISLHGRFLTELKELLGESTSVPRMFVKGRYIGGVEEVVGLNETGRLRRMLSRVGIERRVGRQGCEGCGGVRFVPCLDCGGSCKVVVGDERERCPECNENGLVYCPVCS